MRRVVLAALILAWATQLLATQWAGGASVRATAPRHSGDPRLVLHMRSSGEAAATTVTLADVAYVQWQDAAPDSRPDIGQITVATAAAAAPTLSVGIEEVVRALIEAGIDPRQVYAYGPVRCEVTVVQAPEVSTSAVSTSASQEAALLAWAQPEDEPQPAQSHQPLPQPPPKRQEEPSPPAPDFVGTHGTLGETLRRDLARRLRLPLESVHLSFATKDLPMAHQTGVMAEDIRPLSIGDLGPVAWTIKAAGSERPVTAEASATVTRTVALVSITAGQIIRGGDVGPQQARIHRLAERGLAPTQAVGQHAARNLASGEVLLANTLQPRVLVRAGQLVSVEQMRRGVPIRGLARALEDGAQGQVIRVEVESTGELLHVLMVAPQAGRVVDGPADSAAAATDRQAIGPP